MPHRAGVFFAAGLCPAKFYRFAFFPGLVTFGAMVGDKNSFQNSK
jgi:hypothetical protein